MRRTAFGNLSGDSAYSLKIAEARLLEARDALERNQCPRALQQLLQAQYALGTAVGQGFERGNYTWRALEDDAARVASDFEYACLRKR
jgi:hypothetical protein